MAMQQKWTLENYLILLKKTNTLTLVLSGKYKKHLSVTTRYSYNLLIVIKRESFF